MLFVEEVQWKWRINSKYSPALLLQTSSQRLPDGRRLLCGGVPGHNTNQIGLALCCSRSRQKETECKTLSSRQHLSKLIHPPPHFFNRCSRLPSQSFVAEAMLIMVTVLHLGKSSLPKKPITDDDVDRISLCLKVLSECSPLMNDIFNKECRKSLSHMLTVRLEEEKLSQKVMTV